MSWRINKITLRNFKFFYGVKDIPVEEQNLLVYGDNGSGKSSIFDAIYRLFQSRNINSSDAKAPLSAPNGELRNLYMQPADVCGVSIEFTDSKADPAVAPKIYNLSNIALDTQAVGDLFIKNTISSSDFIDYKNLSSLSDFSAISSDDMFKKFEEEIFPYAQFRHGYPNPDRTYSPYRLASEWWSHANDLMAALPKYTGQRRGQFNRHTPEYLHFTSYLNSLCSEIQFLCDELGQSSTRILQNEFKIKDVEIIFNYDNQFRFNEPTAPHSHHRDHTLHPFKIKMIAKVLNNELPGGCKLISNPKSFFNEARLTCMGLALRLSVLNTKFSLGNFASVLCIDDLLLSLDMSYRMPVVKYILKLATNYQVCIFTHDRSLYLLTQSLIKQNDQDNWKCFSMYSPDPTKITTQRPEPNIAHDEGLLKKAENLISICDYPSAANCLRKFAEHQIKEIIPQNMWYYFDADGNLKNKMLHALWEQTLSEDFLNLYGFRKTDFPNIKIYLDRLMNPLSHDDRDVPIFREELEECIEELKKYQPIIDRKHILVRREDSDSTLFRLQLSYGANSADITFKACEQWDYFDSPHGKMYKRVEVQTQRVVVTGDVHYQQKIKQPVQKLYSDIYYRVKAGVAGVTLPSLEEAISLAATGQRLIDL